MFMYKYKSMNAVKMVENNGIYYNPDGWLWSFIHFIYSLRKHDIHPIFILEGGYPEEKNKTRMARKKDREDVKKKTLSLEESISSYATSLRLRPDMNKEDIPQDLKEEWNKIAKKNNLSFEDFDFETVKDHVKQRHRYDIRITNRDYEKLKILLKIMNTPFIQAPMEAEAFCAYLYKKKVIHGIASNDSDILAYGCNLIVDFEFDKIDEESKITYINYDYLLNKLDLQSSEFLDFCIMCGTDYNDNIYRIGAVKSYELIKVHKCIENVGKFLDPNNKKGTILILNHLRIRHIFNHYGMENMDDVTNMQFLEKKASWSSVPDFYLLTMLAIKFNINIDLEWIKNGFEKCNIKWENENKDNEENVEPNNEVDEFPIF